MNSVKHFRQKRWDRHPACPTNTVASENASPELCIGQLNFSPVSSIRHSERHSQGGLVVSQFGNHGDFYKPSPRTLIRSPVRRFAGWTEKSAVAVRLPNSVSPMAKRRLILATALTGISQPPAYLKKASLHLQEGAHRMPGLSRQLFDKTHTRLRLPGGPALHRALSFHSEYLPGWT